MKQFFECETIDDVRAYVNRQRSRGKEIILWDAAWSRMERTRANALMDKAAPAFFSEVAVPVFDEKGRTLKESLTAEDMYPFFMWNGRLIKAVLTEDGGLMLIYFLRKERKYLVRRTLAGTFRI